MGYINECGQLLFACQRRCCTNGGRSRPSSWLVLVLILTESRFVPNEINTRSRSGLAGYVYTQDYSRAMRFAGKLEVGMVRSPASRLYEFL